MIKELNEHECLLIEKFEAHPFFKSLHLLSWENFLNVLIQRRFLSLSIINVYEFVIDALLNEDFKKTVRSILNEEFPRNSKGVPLPTHREMLFRDLLNLGATREMILKTPESVVTHNLRLKSYQVLAQCLSKDHSELCLLSFLRFWAEVLVSTEYSIFWERISEKLCRGAESGRTRSEFYYFHMVHDRRQSDINEEPFFGGLTHSQELALHIGHLVGTKNALRESVQMAEEATALKIYFYDQFAHLVIQ
jgi:hypothetical protein